MDRFQTLISRLSNELQVQEEAVTKQWDTHFDALLEWLLCPVRDNAPDPSKWQLLEWATTGGLRERRLAAWVAEQRHLASLNRLSTAALARLEVHHSFLSLLLATMAGTQRPSQCGYIYSSSWLIRTNVTP